MRVTCVAIMAVDDERRRLVAGIVQQATELAFANALREPSRHSIGFVNSADLSDEELDEDETPLRTTPPSAYGRMLRNAARHGPCVSAWHGVIPSLQHRTALMHDARQIIGQTFWMCPHDHPRCSLERLALSVLRFHTSKWPGEPRACVTLHR